MIDGDQWAMGEPPTAADIVKYASQKTKLLVQLPYHPTPSELTITDTLNDGDYFRAGRSYMDSWFATSSVRVLAIFPPPEPRKPKGATAAEIMNAFDAMLTGYKFPKGLGKTIREPKAAKPAPKKRKKRKKP